MVSNMAVRVETKKRAAILLRCGQMDFKLLTFQLTDWNGWRWQTNANIIRELIGIGIIEQKRNVVFLAPPKNEKEAER